MTSRIGTAALTALLIFAAAVEVRAEKVPTLYERLGGNAALTAVVKEFMLIMEADDRINFTFAEADLKKFTQLLIDQLCEITQGPCKYTGRDMYTSHEKLKITNAQFNALAEDLYEAFDRVGIPYSVQNEVMALLAPMQRDIVK